ncbi:hypothetical protein FQR65_LT17747 [Abscondita terminalis]|nr:hypothetical protein FQR65_LT17747 [Abscondita terminalis]
MVNLEFFHYFSQDIRNIPVPGKFTFPFCYEPHPLSIIASKELQHYLQHQSEWQHNFGLGQFHTDQPVMLVRCLVYSFVTDPSGTPGTCALFRVSIDIVDCVKPIEYVLIAVIGAPAGNRTSTDSRGQFSLKIDGKHVWLEEVVVQSEKAKYRNKDNPAVELIRKVIDNKEKNRLEAQDYAEFQQYEKISMALSNLSEKFKNRKIFKQYQFLFEKDDSVKNENRYVLPAYIEEKLSQTASRSNHTYNQSVKGWIIGSEYLENISKCQQLTGTDLFRPPYGRPKRSQLKHLKHFKVVMWDILSGDFDLRLTPENWF